MWNLKHLIIAIVFAVCALVCAVSFFFLDGGSIGSFAPTGMVIFAFISFIFFRNSKR